MNIVSNIFSNSEIECFIGLLWYYVGIAQKFSCRDYSAYSSHLFVKTNASGLFSCLNHEIYLQVATNVKHEILRGQVAEPFFIKYMM